MCVCLSVLSHLPDLLHQKLHRSMSACSCVRVCVCVCVRVCVCLAMIFFRAAVNLAGRSGAPVSANLNECKVPFNKAQSSLLSQMCACVCVCVCVCVRVRAEE